MMDSKKVARLSILISVAIILSIIENYLPLPFIVPGAKIGLANIVTMVGIISIGYKDTFVIMIIRIIIGSIFGGGPSGMIYSLSGGLLSFITMVFIKEIFNEKVSAVGISVTGAVFHNIGQVLVASFILNNMLIFSYLPMLTVVGTFSGIFVGMSTNYFLSHLNKVIKKSI